jgi:hypothetical protein
VAISATSVALNAEDATRDRVGRFVYAGGLDLAADPSVRLGGMSDLDIIEGDRLLAVTDEGDMFRARIVLDESGRLSGLTGVLRAPIAGPNNQPLPDKSAADAEGIAVLPSGDVLISFERQHRIWRYPAGGAPPALAPTPESAPTLPINTGLEALAAVPGVAPGAYLVGSEGGTVWLCDLDAGCRDTPLGRHVPDGYGLTALAVSPDGETLAMVARAFDAVRGVRVIVRLLGREAIARPDASILDELALLAPLTRDNFEGVALVRGAGDAALRLYLLSDNNYSATQRTYLLAFDWSPPDAPEPDRGARR